MQYPRFDKEFILSTDASGKGLGAVLSQKDETGKDRPICFASRTLNEAEQKYGATELELLAIVWSIRKFRNYLLGRKFTLVTDCRPLKWLYSLKDPQSRLFRYKAEIENYEFTVVYREGCLNHICDHLSRYPLDEKREEPKEIPSPDKDETLINLDTGMTTQNLKTPKPIFTTQHFESYENFPKFHYIDALHTRISVQTSNDSAFDKSVQGQALAVFLPVNLENTNDETLSKIKHYLNLNELPNSHANKTEVQLVESRGKGLIICYFKKDYFENAIYADIFYTLQNLRNLVQSKGITKLAIEKPFGKYNRVDVEKFKEIIFYIFQGTNIELTLYLNLRHVLTDTEITQALKENHDSPIGGHCGFHKMYICTNER